MPAERAGYTVTMFLVDISPSMGKLRSIELPGNEGSIEITHLEWALQFVKLKVQEMIFDGRKTDKCGVITFGSEDTNNVINEKNGGYDNVSEYIPIDQPNHGTLAKIDALQPSDISGDPIDALIVGIETQDVFLGSKKTWTRKIIILTDGESPIEVEDWEATVKKMTSLDIILTVVGVDFDDEEVPFHEEDKSPIKKANETFYHTLTSALPTAVLGTLSAALTSLAYPSIKTTKSVLMGTVLRIGDVEGRPEEAAEVLVKTSKCTALARPKGWKKFAKRGAADEDEEMPGDDDEEAKVAYAQLTMRTEYFIDRTEHDDEDEEGDNEGVRKNKNKNKDAMDVDEDESQDKSKVENIEKVEKEQLVRGFKYGSTYAPCPDGQFPKLPTRKGIDICGFFPSKNFRRDYPMGEVQYVWASPTSVSQQVALSSIVQAMEARDVMAIARWVTRDGADPKMGVLSPSIFENVDCLLWVQMPFADDVRKYTFASLDNLVNKKGEVVTKHPYIPTAEQQEAMDKFVDAMDVMHAGEKDEEGNRYPWYDTRLSYNPAIHRTKQALFHSAVVQDLATNPLPPPHPELLKYFNPPKKVLKRARDALEECKDVFKVKEVPKKVTRQRKDGHVPARDEDESMLLLDPKPLRRTLSKAQTTPSKKAVTADNSDTEDSDTDLLLEKPKNDQALPTPERSISPEIDPGRAPGRIIGTTFPLQDFQNNLSQGDLVSKAVEDLGYVIKEIVIKPFSWRRNSELLECMSTFREVAVKEDEIDAWNGFLRDLRETCLSEPGNKDFWAQVQKQGRDISLISKPEAAKYGGISLIPESEAEGFLV